MKSWPKLSETAPKATSAKICQFCHREHTSVAVWLECDERDQPGMAVVIACSGCVKKHITPHPRLYKQMDFNQPVPGVMACCTGCAFLRGVLCTSPQLKANGGTGLRVKYAPPRFSFVDGTINGRRAGWTARTFPEPPMCEGRTEQSL